MEHFIEELKKLEQCLDGHAKWYTEAHLDTIFVSVATLTTIVRRYMEIQAANKEKK